LACLEAAILHPIFLAGMSACARSTKQGGRLPGGSYPAFCFAADRPLEMAGFTVVFVRIASFHIAAVCETFAPMKGRWILRLVLVWLVATGLVAAPIVAPSFAQAAADTEAKNIFKWNLVRHKARISSSYC